MTITLLFFAWLREQAGAGADVLEVADGATAADVAATVLGRMGVTDDQAGAIRYAVNESFVAADHVLRDGDRLAFIPPTSGG